MIKKANYTETLNIYTYLEKDFPKNEIPEYEKYEEMTKNGIHQAYLYKENHKDIAYFITLEKDNNVLISHLAVIKEYRDKGVGSRFIEDIKEFLLSKNLIIVEVEAEKMANNEKELETIQKRLRYYKKAGFKKCEGIEYNLFDVDYDILTYSMKQQDVTNVEVKNIMEQIYKGKFSQERLKINLVFRDGGKKQEI